MSFLANEGDPYVTPKGEVLRKENGRTVQVNPNDVTTTTPILRNLSTNSRRNLNEMPSADPSIQKAINVIMVYQLLGLTPNETAHTLGITIEQVQEIQALDAYQTTFDAVFGELLSINTNSIQAKIASAAGDAIDTVIGLSQDADKDIVKLKASQDLLDRSGLSPDTLFGKNAQDEDIGLKIVIEDAADRPDAPKVDINVNINKRR